jgi:hypothetical protein
MAMLPKILRLFEIISFLFNFTLNFIMIIVITVIFLFLSHTRITGTD